jgi:hypothetical protein
MIAGSYSSCSSLTTKDLEFLPGIFFGCPRSLDEWQPHLGKESCHRRCERGPASCDWGRQRQSKKSNCLQGHRNKEGRQGGEQGALGSHFGVVRVVLPRLFTLMRSFHLSSRRYLWVWHLRRSAFFFLVNTGKENFSCKARQRAGLNINWRLIGKGFKSAEQFSVDWRDSDTHSIIFG